LVFDDLQKCLALLNSFEEKTIFLSENLLISPPDEKISAAQRDLLTESKSSVNITNIEKVRILNPKLDRNLRQKSMRNWLMPFGFIAGLTFSNMTSLTTFSFLGFNQIGESIIGGFLGMGSGLLGSIVASSSINLNRNKEIRSILNFNKDGKWIILLEDQIGYELPWILLRDSGPLDMIFMET
tara:strand:+ start:888 stop:1436 length:549 start_codon:yes stop_codon:yes gene_type:complete